MSWSLLPTSQNVEQPAQFGWSALGKAPFAAMLARVIRSGIQAGESDESIRALQWHPLESVDQSGADDRANNGP